MTCVLYNQIHLVLNKHLPDPTSRSKDASVLLCLSPGIAIAIVRGLASEQSIDKAWGPDKVWTVSNRLPKCLIIL